MTGARRRHGVAAASRARRDRRGHSLVAVLIAMVLLAVGAMSLLGASASTTTFHTLAQNRTNGLAIARTYLEELRMRDPWTVQSEASVQVDAEGVPASDGHFARRVTVTTVRQNLLQVTVHVDLPRGATPVSLTTAVFRGAQVD
jgi:type IV pilus assembly protein PilV